MSIAILKIGNMSTSVRKHSSCSAFTDIQLLDSARASLKPTTTIVRHSAIICHGWEEAAIQDSASSSVGPERSPSAPTYPVCPAPNETAPCRSRIAILDDIKSSATAWRQKLRLGKPSSPHRPELIPEYNSTHVAASSGLPLDRLVPENDWTEMHGFRGNPRWPAPYKVLHCDVEARPGYATKLAHEYEDTIVVLAEKVKVLAKLILESRNCLVYTGAGISTSSGINDYASRSLSVPGRPVLRSPYEAQPTPAHRTLVAMHRAHLIHYWVQQSHDGLPQKAGLPQECLNEIHGAWYDPSNPVVAMNGNLRSDLFNDLLSWEHRTDLTLSMGTSMCGMNSDRVFTTVAKKGLQGSALGGVIISLQQTQFDNMTCLRIFAKLDVVMTMLQAELGLSVDHVRYVPKSIRGATDEEDVFRIPYDTDGCLVLPRGKAGVDNYANCTTLNLKVGSVVKLTNGPYKGDEGYVLGKNFEGHYRIQFMHVLDRLSDPFAQPRPFETILGCWWVEVAVNGKLPSIPVVNVIV